MNKVNYINLHQKLEDPCNKDILALTNAGVGEGEWWRSKNITIKEKDFMFYVVPFQLSAARNKMQLARLEPHNDRRKVYSNDSIKH